MTSLTRAHTGVHKHMHRRTRPFNAATQWGSVSNAALVFLFFIFFKHGDRERFVGTQPLFSHSPSCKNNLRYIIKCNHCYPISACVFDVSLWILNEAFVHRGQAGLSFRRLARSLARSLGLRWPRYTSHDFDWRPSC